MPEDQGALFGEAITEPDPIHTWADRPSAATKRDPMPANLAAGMAGSNRAGEKWSEIERAAIDNAIHAAARELEEFTADQVWARAPGVRVTKGLAGRLNAARNAGWIEGTGRVAFAARGGIHDHRQRLAVWRSLVVAPEAAR